jgi:RNA-directed DNA polymerase
MELQQNLRCSRGLLEPDAWTTGKSGSEGAPAQQCVGATRRWHIERRRRTGRDGKMAVYTYPSKKALLSIMAKVRSVTGRDRHRTLADLLKTLNPVLRGWCNYFYHGVSSKTFEYLDHFSWWRVARWLRKRHRGLNWGTLRRRFLPGWEIADGKVEMFRPRQVSIIRYRYRGSKIPTPWTSKFGLSVVPQA